MLLFHKEKRSKIQSKTDMQLIILCHLINEKWVFEEKKTRLLPLNNLPRLLMKSFGYIICKSTLI